MGEKAEQMMNAMANNSGKLVGKTFCGKKVTINDMFEYKDPVDGSVSKNQGIRIIFSDGSRIIFRLSGTGVAGATVRLYLEKYVPKDGDLGGDQFEVVKDMAKVALEISQLTKYTGRENPTVIT